jgi:hypothetical protein
MKFYLTFVCLVIAFLLVKSFFFILHHRESVSFILNESIHWLSLVSAESMLWKQYVMVIGVSFFPFSANYSYININYIDNKIYLIIGNDHDNAFWQKIYAMSCIFWNTEVLLFWQQFHSLLMWLWYFDSVSFRIYDLNDNSFIEWEEVYINTVATYWTWCWKNGKVVIHLWQVCSLVISIF